MLEFNEYISELRNFLDSTPSKYLVVDAVAKRLLQSGFRELNLKCKFPELKEGDKVFCQKKRIVAIRFCNRTQTLVRDRDENRVGT